MFALCGDDDRIQAYGVRRRLSPGVADTLGARVRAFFAARPDGPPLLVGALPFDRAQADFLVQPELVRQDADFPRARSGAAPIAVRTVTPVPAREAFAAAVARALPMLNGGLRKVVLSRGLEIQLQDAPDAVGIAANLAQDATVVTFITSLDDPQAGAPRLMVGATPELLVARRGAEVLSHPLAGSAPRLPDAAADRAAAETLLRSDKDQHEHALVVEYILDLLTPYCHTIACPEGTTLRSTQTMWHLGTRIVGQLRDDGVSSAELAALLHPTPAVGGFPRDAAADAIRSLEARDRGFYAGAVGWTDAAGDGRWYVTLRCAELCGRRMTLYAGAGVVPGSDPQAEVAETSAKFRAMLKALGLQGEDIGGPMAKAVGAYG